MARDAETDADEVATVDVHPAHARTLEAAGSEVGSEVVDATGDEQLRRLLVVMGGEPMPFLAPGTHVGDYVVESRIGAGGMGVVYRARDARLERDVALKLHARVDSESGRARALREASAMARLSHPNVVTVFGVGTHGDHLYIAMEFVAGENARKWRHGAQRSWRELVELYLAAGRGLAAAHGAGIVHRDFKPDNVLVGRDGRVRVADFGLARKDGDAPATEPQLAAGSGSAFAGTPGYMPPEQLAGQAGPAADQFAFGVALAEALHEARPVAGATLRGHGVPPAVDRAIARAIAAAPGDRWPSMDAAIAAIARAASPRRRRRAIVALAAVPVVAGAAVALALVPRGGSAWHPAIVELQPHVDEDSDAASVSPDGATLAFASDAEQRNHYRVFLQPIGGGGRRALTPPDQPIARAGVRWARDGAAVLAIDGDRGNAIVRIPIDGGAQSVVFAGRAAGFDDCGGRLALVYSPPDCPGCSAIATVVPGEAPHELARIAPGPRIGWLRCDRSGTRAVYVDRAAYTMAADVWMISLVDGTRTRLTSDGKNNLDPIFTADGRAVLYSSTRNGQPNLWEQPLAGGAARAVTSGAGPDLGPSPTPDGRALVFDVDVTSVHLIAVRDGVHRQLTTEAREIIGGAAASPDGARVAAVRSDGPTPQVLMIDVASGEGHVIGAGDHVAFSLDGKELVYAAVAPPRLIAVAIAGGASRQLAELPGPVESLAIGSDARIHLSIVAAEREAWSVGMSGGDLARDAPAPVALVVPGPAGNRFELVCPGTQPCAGRVEPGDVRLETTDAEWASDGSLHYCTRHMLTRLDLATGRATASTTECRMGFAVSPDGATLYTTEYAGHVRRMVITNFAAR